MFFRFSNSTVTCSLWGLFWWQLTSTLYCKYFWLHFESSSLCITNEITKISFLNANKTQCKLASRNMVSFRSYGVCYAGRLLKDAVQDPAWGRRYEQVLGALLCLCGSKLRAELDKQTQLVTLLGVVAERVRQAGGSARQVGLSLCHSVKQWLFERKLIFWRLCI